MIPLGQQIKASIGRRKLGGSPFHCPACGGERTAVVDSRPNIVGIRRRRMCLTCRHRVTTYEMHADELRKVLATLRRLRALFSAGLLADIQAISDAWEGEDDEQIVIEPQQVSQ